MSSAPQGPYPSCGRPRPWGLPAPAPDPVAPRHTRSSIAPCGGSGKAHSADKNSLSSADQLVQSHQLGGARCGAGPGLAGDEGAHECVRVCVCPQTGL